MEKGDLYHLLKHCIPNDHGWTAHRSTRRSIKWGERTGRRPALINLRQLMFCGHLVFHARKP